MGGHVTVMLEGFLHECCKRVMRYRAEGTPTSTSIPLKVLSHCTPVAGALPFSGLWGQGT